MKPPDFRQPWWLQTQFLPWIKIFFMVMAFLGLLNMICWKTISYQKIIWAFFSVDDNFTKNSTIYMHSKHLTNTLVNTLSSHNYLYKAWESLPTLKGMASPPTRQSLTCHLLISWQTSPKLMPITHLDTSSSISLSVTNNCNQLSSWFMKI